MSDEKPIDCPFEVGNIVRTDHITVTNPDGSTFQVPESPKVATITAIGDDGFDYEYPALISWVPRLGLAFKGGQCAPERYGDFTLATQEELDQFEPSIKNPPLGITTTSNG